MAFQFQLAQPGFAAGQMFDVLTQLNLTTNLKLVLDAGDAASYTSGQKWLDRAGSGYDFFLGADGTVSATDPTFTGVVGRQSAAEYWSFDGGDDFTYDSANEAWMETLHKDNAIFSIVCWIYTPASAVATRSILGTYGGTTGIVLNYLTSQVLFQVDNAAVPALSLVLTAPVVGAWNFIAIAINETAGTSAVQINGTASAPSSTYTSPAAGSASFPMQIGAAGNGLAKLGSGTRMNSLAMWQGTALTAANLAAIYTATRSKFGV